MEGKPHKISAEAIRELVSLNTGSPIASWDFLDVPKMATTHALRRQFDESLGRISKSLKSEGYARVSLAPLIECYPQAIAAAATTSFVSLIGNPFRVFLRHPHWRRLEADLERPPERSGGIGRSPMHMDFVNAENPPDLICLLCLRSDPLGGGASRVACLDGIERMLRPSNVEILKSSVFVDGTVTNLSGVGNDVNPFAVISPDSIWKYRFTGNLLKSPTSARVRIALQELSDVIDSRVVSFTLTQGELLILDQHRVVHGRGALGKGQQRIPSVQRRLLLQSYLRQANVISFPTNIRDRVIEYGTNHRQRSA